MIDIKLVQSVDEMLAELLKFTIYSLFAIYL